MTRSRTTPVIATLAAITLAALIYWGIDPMSGFFPRCLFHTLTGLQCPGCGTQRAIHALLHADIPTAWHHNALLFILLPIIALIILAESAPRRFPRLHAALTSTPAIFFILALITLWTIIRNL